MVDDLGDEFILLTLHESQSEESEDEMKIREIKINLVHNMNDDAASHWFISPCLYYALVPRYVGCSIEIQSTFSSGIALAPITPKHASSNDLQVNIPNGFMLRVSMYIRARIEGQKAWETGRRTEQPLKGAHRPSETDATRKSLHCAGE